MTLLLCVFLHGLFALSRPWRPSVFWCLRCRCSFSARFAKTSSLNQCPSPVATASASPASPHDGVATTPSAAPNVRRCSRAARNFAKTPSPRRCRSRSGPKGKTARLGWRSGTYIATCARESRPGRWNRALSASPRIVQVTWSRTSGWRPWKFTSSSNRWPLWRRAFAKGTSGCWSFTAGTTAGVCVCSARRASTWVTTPFQWSERVARRRWLQCLQSFWFLLGHCSPISLVTGHYHHHHHYRCRWKGSRLMFIKWSRRDCTKCGRSNTLLSSAKWVRL